MASGQFLFDDFALDPADRRLRRAGAPVDLSGRYLDALALLLRERGTLVTKDRFMAEVWRGVPVTDEALTQCVRTLRRVLGDDAARPRFIETVPRHGYRFIADAAWSDAPGATPGRTPVDWRRIASAGATAAAGGGIAGAIGGLLYGFAAGPQPGMGAASAVLVLMALGAAIGLAGGAGVGCGIATASAIGARSRWQWSAAGGMVGGLVVGALVKLLGVDAFHMLFGHAPAEMTGAAEGALLGAAVGLGSALARASRSVARALALAGAAGGAAGSLIPLLGGHLLGGSLDGLARRFPDARFRLDAIGSLFGEAAFGPVSQAVTGAIEGLLFTIGVVGALVLTRDRRDR